MLFLQQCGMLWICTDYVLTTIYAVPAYHCVNFHNHFPYRVDIECCSESISGLSFLLFHVMNFGWSKITVEKVFFGSNAPIFLKYAFKWPGYHLPHCLLPVFTCAWLPLSMRLDDCWDLLKQCGHFVHLLRWLNTNKQPR